MREGLQRLNQRFLAGRLGALAQGCLEPLDSLGRGGDFRQVIGKDDPIGQLLELELPQPLEVALAPVAHPDRRAVALA